MLSWPATGMTSMARISGARVRLGVGTFQCKQRLDGGEGIAVGTGAYLRAPLFSGRLCRVCWWDFASVSQVDASFPRSFPDHEGQKPGSAATGPSASGHSSNYEASTFHLAAQSQNRR